MIECPVCRSGPFYESGLANWCSCRRMSYYRERGWKFVSTEPRNLSRASRADGRDVEVRVLTVAGGESTFSSERWGLVGFKTMIRTSRMGDAGYDEDVQETLRVATVEAVLGS